MKKVILFLFGCLALAGGWLISEPKGVAKGVTLDGQDVAGKSLVELRKYSELRLKNRLNETYEFHVPGGTPAFRAKPKELGLHFHHPTVQRTLAAAVAEAWIAQREPQLWKRAASRFGQQAVVFRFDAEGLDRKRVNHRTQSKAWMVDAHVMKVAQFQIGADEMQAIASAFANRTTKVQLNPKRTVVTLVRRAQHTTRIYTKDPGSRANIARAARLASTVVLQPGASFSYNKTLGPRTYWAAGWSIVNGERVKEPGGGICQVSSTLHIAAVKSGLEINRRREHGRVARYAPAGLDSTVDWASRTDLVFTNNTPSPIALRTAHRNGRVTTVVYSAEPLPKVTIERHKREANGRLYVEVIRTIERDGKTERRRLNRSRYRL